MKKLLFFCVLIAGLFLFTAPLYATDNGLMLNIEIGETITITDESGKELGMLSLSNNGNYIYESNNGSLVDAVYLRPIIDEYCTMRLTRSKEGIVYRITGWVANDEKGIIVSLMSSATGNSHFDTWIPFKYIGQVEDSVISTGNSSAALTLNAIGNRLTSDFIVLGIFIISQLSMLLLTIVLFIKYNSIHKKLDDAYSRILNMYGYILGDGKNEDIETRLFRCYQSEQRRKKREIDEGYRIPTHEPPEQKQQYVPEPKKRDAETVLCELLNKHYIQSFDLDELKSELLNHCHDIVEEVFYIRYNPNTREFKKSSDNENDFLAMIKTKNKKCYIIPSPNMAQHLLTYCDICYEVRTKNWPAKVYRLATAEFTGKSYIVKDEGVISD